MFYQLPPVGNRVCLDVTRDSTARRLFPTDKTWFYSSGTAALAAAISAVSDATRQLKKSCRQPEVIMPAYACPDLVSAAVFAGVRPVLVDLEANRPWLDLSKLADAITGETIAVIGVNLFGLAERWKQLRDIATKEDIFLIEDSAQYFPGADECVNWQGDLVVISFGRGKPVSLLGGGAVLTENTSLFDLLPKPQIEIAALTKSFTFRLKARIYNAMISPYLYWLPQMLPFMHLGETRYHQLDSIDAMARVYSDILASNISRYRDDESTGRRQKISSMLESLGNVHDLPRECKMDAKRRLLRYPLLLEAVSRDRAYQKLKQAGLGPSVLYPASLPKISGLSDIIDGKQSFPNADDFASRLLTLPVHAGVNEVDIGKMGSILRDLE